MPAQLNAALGCPEGYVVLVSSDRFLRHGFWRPGMPGLHARVWDELHARGLRFWSDISREIRVHPADLSAAQVVLLRAQATNAPRSSAAAV